MEKKGDLLVSLCCPLVLRLYVPAVAKRPGKLLMFLKSPNNTINLYYLVLLIGGVHTDLLSYEK